MDIRTAIAAQSYATAKPATAPAAPEGSARNPAAQAAGSFAETLSRGEETAQAALAGKADAHALVQALAETELAVETAVTLRDKVVEAYQEILRMPV
ncbi:flagellar hook-basal body complex protein FliE [Alkalilacustris brevis]|uniref:flagellar hook-basal body complex protein FliE n=1 Tax=Alkalilacustris brevis TaxID=2026338 RepID=UPI000E0D1DB9|nr:flagellar hook-basal body complex protein FliE [Alkalilacustris brevis]